MDDSSINRAFYRVYDGLQKIKDKRESRAAAASSR